MGGGSEGVEYVKGIFVVLEGGVLWRKYSEEWYSEECPFKPPPLFYLVFFLVVFASSSLAGIIVIVNKQVAHNIGLSHAFIFASGALLTASLLHIIPEALEVRPGFLPGAKSRRVLIDVATDRHTAGLQETSLAAGSAAHHPSFAVSSF